MTAAQRAPELYTLVWPNDCEAIILRDTSIQALMEDGRIASYVGYTSAVIQADRERERFNFLVNRKYPVLKWRGGEHFTHDEVTDTLGFTGFTLWNNGGHKMNCGLYARCVEGHLHLLMQGFPLGIL